LVVAEFIKHRFNAGQPADLYFWRDKGHEADLLFEVGAHLQAVEIKSGATFVSDWLTAIGKWRSLAGDIARPPWIVYGGAESYRREGAKVFSWRDLADVVRG
jgi:hypothetical protein